MSGPKLIAAVGQPWMRDLAFGSHVVEHLLTGGTLPSDVDAIDMSFGAVTAFQMIQDAGYAQVVFVTARADDRPRGTLYERSADLPEVSPQELQLRIGDCITGCISLDSLIYICRHWHALPADCSIIEIEPEDDHWGPELSEGAATLVAPAAAMALRLVLERPPLDQKERVNPWEHPI